MASKRLVPLVRRSHPRDPILETVTPFNQLPPEGMMLRTVFFRALAIVVVAAPMLGAQQTATPQKAVLVTGASSGIGRKIAETLAAQGHFVYATARQADDIAALSKIPNVQGVKLDVTSHADIAAAVETVRKGGRGLYGIVNNAGIAVLAPLINVEDKEMASIFDVNVFGPYRVTKAFAPMLLESKGRVVNISSISGILSGAFFGPYSMTKHAIEAYTDSFNAEMAQQGVRSSLIEPGNYRSEIGRNTMAQAQQAAARLKGTPFEATAGRMVAAMGNYDNYPEPDEVAKAAAHALFDPAPKVRYMVVPVANQAAATIRKAIEEVVQLNQAHQFTFDRDALIRMLDSALVRWK
jgi:NAD(P)-dependent dehydrogenase (short-subunit alcohol dehydrogenase family)